MKCRKCHSFVLNPSRRTRSEKIWQCLIPVKPVRCSACGYRRYTPDFETALIHVLTVAVVALGLSLLFGMNKEQQNMAGVAGIEMSLSTNALSDGNSSQTVASQNLSH